MRLTVLGGSAAGPNTGQGCSGYLVQSGETRVVLDLGPGTLPELRRHADYRTLDGIVISHLHLDHVLDLLALRFALAYNPIPAPLPVPLWLPPGGNDFLRKAAAAFAAPGEAAEFFPSVFSIAEYDPDSTVEIGDLVITFARTLHPVPCWAMRLSSAQQPDRDLVFTADTGSITDLMRFGDGAAVLLSEATLPAPADTPGKQGVHITAAEAGDMARAIGVETLVLTHIWEESGSAETVDQAAETFSGKIALARPGLQIEW